jgi:hypothetical protein
VCRLKFNIAVHPTPNSLPTLELGPYSYSYIQLFSHKRESADSSAYNHTLLEHFKFSAVEMPKGGRIGFPLLDYSVRVLPQPESILHMTAFFQCSARD